jgi:DNA-binding GntR family transcriptional regulator
MARGNSVLLSESAYRRLREAIVTAEVRPGSFLLDRDIAALVGASRTPVREALARLATEGWIESVPRRGYRVRTLELGELPQLGEMVGGVEAAASGHLAEAPNPPRLAYLRQLAEECVKAVERPDLEGFLTADDRFHRYLLGDVSRYPLSGMFYQLMVDQLHRMRRLAEPAPRDQARHVEEHRLLLLAMELGDHEAARLLARGHRARMVERLIRALAVVELPSEPALAAKPTTRRRALRRSAPLT